jgi:hypothetical protein
MKKGVWIGIGAIVLAVTAGIAMFGLMKQAGTFTNIRFFVEAGGGGAPNRDCNLTFGGQTYYMGTFGRSQCVDSLNGCNGDPGLAPCTGTWGGQNL